MAVPWPFDCFCNAPAQLSPRAGVPGATKTNSPGLLSSRPVQPPIVSHPDDKGIVHARLDPAKSLDRDPVKAPKTTSSYPLAASQNRTPLLKTPVGTAIISGHLTDPLVRPRATDLAHEHAEVVKPVALQTSDKALKPSSHLSAPPKAIINDVNAVSTAAVNLVTVPALVSAPPPLPHVSAPTKATFKDVNAVGTAAENMMLAPALVSAASPPPLPHLSAASEATIKDVNACAAAVELVTAPVLVSAPPPRSNVNETPGDKRRVDEQTDHTNEVLPANSANVEPNKRPTLGDVVRVIFAETLEKAACVGSFGAIILDDEDDLPYEIEGLPGWVWKESEVALKDRYRPTVGDVVRVIGGETSEKTALVGHIGTVISDDRDARPFEVSGAPGWCWKESEVCLASA